MSKIRFKKIRNSIRSSIAKYLFGNYIMRKIFDNIEYNFTNNGENNHICFNNKLLSSADGLNICINGNGNNITLCSINTSKREYFKRCKINITGNNNSIHLNESVHGIFDIEILAQNCLVEIGENTGFTGTDIKLWDDNSRVLLEQGLLCPRI